MQTLAFRCRPRVCISPARTRWEKSTRICQKIALCCARGSPCTRGTDAAAHGGQVSSPLPWPLASSLWHHPAKQLSALTGVCAHHWPTLQREREGEKRRRRRRRRGGECDSVRLCTCSYVYPCERACVSCTVAMSHTAWGATMHLRPARQMCTA